MKKEKIITLYQSHPPINGKLGTPFASYAELSEQKVVKKYTNPSN